MRAALRLLHSTVYHFKPILFAAVLNVNLKFMMTREHQQHII